MAVKVSSTLRGNTIGVFGTDKPHGNFSESWQILMADYKFKTMDIAFQIDCIMAVKDECELNTIQMACSVSVDIFDNCLKERISEIIHAKNVSSTQFVLIVNEPLIPNNRSMR